MADKRTSEMVQRRSEYVPENLRPDGRLEKIGWYAPSVMDTFRTGMGPWPIAERKYDTNPFGADIGVDRVMEYVLRELLLGNSAKKAKEDLEKKNREALEIEARARQAGWVGESNSESNRFGEQGDFNR